MTTATVPTDRLVAVLATATPEEARVVWQALQQFIDNQAEREDDEDPSEEETTAQALQDRLDAAMASYAEPSTPVITDALMEKLGHMRRILTQAKDGHTLVPMTREDGDRCRDLVHQGALENEDQRFWITSLGRKVLRQLDEEIAR